MADPREGVGKIMDNETAKLRDEVLRRMLKTPPKPHKPPKPVKLQKNKKPKID